MHPLIGTQLDQYRIESLLGEGGMGSVFRGLDTNLARPVAVKVMHSQYARQPAFRERFLQEAKAPASLSHPSIVHVYEFGSTQGTLFIVMEYVPGETLRDHIHRAGVSGQVVDLKETLVVLGHVAGALDYAHRRGVVHRDIKPDNILLRRLDDPEREGDPPLRAVVTDFGLAKLLEGGVETQTGTFLGTLPYMSPEQVFGQSLDGRSDLYSLGVVLYRLTTGRLPLDIQSPTDAILKHQNETPLLPRRLRPGIPPGVEAIIQKTLEKDPGDRYQSARDLFRDLRRAADQLTDDELTEYAPASEVHSIITAPQAAGGDEPERPAGFSKADLSPGSAGGSRIHIMVPDKTIRSLSIVSDRLTVGRGEGCDVIIEDPLISKQHARVEFDGTQFFIVDLNSTNGTFLEDARLLSGIREPWKPGKLVRIGSSWLRLETTTEPPSMPESIPGPPEPADVPQHQSMSGWISLFLAQDAFTLKPGSGAAIPVHVLNQGTIVDHFRVSLEGLPPGWTPPEQAELHLMPGVRREATLRIPPPPTNLSAGTYTAELRATSRASPLEFAAAGITFVVSPDYRVELSLTPQKHRSLVEGQFEVEIANRGNAEVSVSLSGRDPENACRFDFSPNPVVVAPQETGKSALSVGAAFKVSGWSGRSYLFTVAGASEGDVFTPGKIQGEWEQIPPEFEVVLQPQTGQGPAPGRFTVELTTYSPDPVDVLLEATDPGGACRYDFSPEKVQLVSGERLRADLTVSPLDPRTPQTIALTVAARLAPAPHLYRQAVGSWEFQPEPEPVGLPEPVTLADPGALPEPVGARPRSRGFAGCVVLLIALGVTLGCGYQAGSATARAFPGDELLPFIPAGFVWLAGLWISIVLFNRVRRPGR